MQATHHLLVTQTKLPAFIRSLAQNPTASHITRTVVPSYNQPFDLMASSLPRQALRLASSTPILRAAASRRCASTLVQNTSRRSTTTQWALPKNNSGKRAYSSLPPGGSPPPRDTNKIAFWPFVAVFALGSGGYMLLVNRRKGELFFPPFLRDFRIWR